ncbi:MAG: helix-turn-helix transcriptional regulator [Chloroflexi bacterium]|nr:helix-turn-helix transcriptional regulator [Chloroflexota bacterium]
MHHRSPASIEQPSWGSFPVPRLAGERGAVEELLAATTCDVRLAGAYCFDGAWDVPTRITPHYILCIGVAGRAEVTIGSERFLLARDTLILTPPHVPQAFVKVSEEDLGFYTVHFTAQVYGFLDSPSLYRLPFTLTLPPPRMLDFQAAARRIVEELATARPGCLLAAAGECARMLAWLWRETADRGGAQAEHDVTAVAALPRLAPVLRTIQARYAEPLRVRDLASAVHLHPAWFSTRFKQLTGLSPAQYLMRYRLERARELLASSDQSVREIAAMTGFQDPLYLSRQFRRLLGTSPTAYRRSASLATRLLEP